MRSEINTFNKFPKSGRAAAVLASAALLFSGCTIDSYLTDTNNVHCDGKRTIADFGDVGSRVSFFGHQKDADILTVAVTRESEDKYSFSAEPAANNVKGRVSILGDTVHDGSADPDFSFTYADAVWSVDLRPDDPSAVISCSAS